MNSKNSMLDLLLINGTYCTQIFFNWGKEIKLTFRTENNIEEIKEGNNDLNLRNLVVRSARLELEVEKLSKVSYFSCSES